MSHQLSRWSQPGGTARLREARRGQLRLSLATLGMGWQGWSDPGRLWRAFDRRPWRRHHLRARPAAGQLGRAGPPALSAVPTRVAAGCHQGANSQDEDDYPPGTGHWPTPASAGKVSCSLSGVPRGSGLGFGEARPQVTVGPAVAGKRTLDYRSVGPAHPGDRLDDDGRFENGVTLVLPGL